MKLRLAVAVLVIAAAPLLLQTPYWRGILIVCAMNCLLALSLNLVIGYTGQLNLGQSAFFAIGAYVSTILTKTYGWNFWLAVPAAIAAAGVLGLALAAFAVRLRGHYLAIASLGFAVITYQVLINWERVTEGVRGIYGILPPPGFRDQLALFYLVAGIALVVYVVLDNLVRSPIGETLRAIREDEVSAASLGINAARWKAFAFGVGAAIAGLAGCFYPGFVGTLVPEAFNIVESFTMMAMVIVGGMGTMIGPVIGAIVLTFLPELLRSVGELRLLVYGVALTLVVLFMPGGLVQIGAALREKAGVTALLEARGVSKSFGGVRAVRDISVAIPEKSIFALIGPNGAGKSTLLNLLSGIYQPDVGALSFAGEDLIGLPAHRRVRLGIARTFQKIRLFKQLTVLENVLAGFHIHHEIPAWQYVVPGAAAGRDRSRCRAEAEELLAFVGLAARAGERAGALPYGQQRMLEIARSLATRPRLFMLDEPAAGLNGAEVAFLLQRLEDIGRRGITVVVVEHNMDLVMNVAQRVFVMDYGEHLFEGTPREVQANPRVIEAYLGGEFQ